MVLDLTVAIGNPEHDYKYGMREECEPPMGSDQRGAENRSPRVHRRLSGAILVILTKRITAICISSDIGVIDEINWTPQSRVQHEQRHVSVAVDVKDFFEFC